MAAAVWRATWPLERIRQRAFFSFGMDMLLSFNLEQIREFFAAFFNLSEHHWHGFLSARLSFPELIGFGLSLFVEVGHFSSCSHSVCTRPVCLPVSGTLCRKRSWKKTPHGIS